jgi:phage shock protein A
MSWLSQFTFVMRSSITRLREQVEDPERMLHQLILDLEEEHARVRRSVARAIADEIQLGKRVERQRNESRQWLERAGQALKRGDETASQSALAQKVDADERLAKLEAEHQKQSEQTAGLRNSVREMEDRIRQAKQKQTLLLARLARAESNTLITHALEQADGSNALAQFARLEDRVERAEAMNAAYEQLSGGNPSGEALEREFQETARREQVAREFAELKQRMTGDA